MLPGGGPRVSSSDLLPGTCRDRIDSGTPAEVSGHDSRGGVRRMRTTCSTGVPPSLITALIVGTVLTTINQGDRILGGDITTRVVLKMGLTYCVPFCVSTSGALGAMQIDDRERS